MTHHRLNIRQREPEWMDESDVDPAELSRALIFIRRINTLLGYTRATLGHLERLTQGMGPGEELRILDVATGSADIPRAILRWADTRKLRCKIVALDLHQRTLVSAQREASSTPDLQFIRGDATALPFADWSFDFAITSMFLHHLDEIPAIAVLREMDRVAKRGVIIADLLRTRRAYAWITLFTLFARPMVKHDARVSVAGAFSRAELLALRDRANLGYLQPYHHFGHRLVLAGCRERTPETGLGVTTGKV